MRWEVANVQFSYSPYELFGRPMRIHYSETIVIFTSADGEQWAKNARDLSVSDLVAGAE